MQDLFMILALSPAVKVGLIVVGIFVAIIFILMIFALAIITAFPQIATWLPSTTRG